MSDSDSFSDWQFFGPLLLIAVLLFILIYMIASFTGVLEDFQAFDIW